MPIRKRKVNKVSQNQKKRVTSLVQQKVKPQISGKFHGSQWLIKKYSFAELERLIKQTQQAKKKDELLANQQKRKQKKEARIKVQQAKEASRQQKQQRLKEIYSYFRSQLYKQNLRDSPYFTPHLDLPPHLA
ncbi:9896_t:CDS:2, partial [Cetraspora pellucida]